MPNLNQAKASMHKGFVDICEDCFGSIPEVASDLLPVKLETDPLILESSEPNCSPKK